MPRQQPRTPAPSSLGRPACWGPGAVGLAHQISATWYEKSNLHTSLINLHTDHYIETELCLYTVIVLVKLTCFFPTFIEAAGKFTLYTWVTSGSYRTVQSVKGALHNFSEAVTSAPYSLSQKSGEAQLQPREALRGPLSHERGLTVKKHQAEVPELQTQELGPDSPRSLTHPPRALGHSEHTAGRASTRREQSSLPLQREVLARPARTHSHSGASSGAAGGGGAESQRP